ncbi:hypothetical protein ON010_g16320 [Phytophthora cinnamomi]|nr:hypothetical protein ON010_g16320 [Phytophthora cinnamomi]
MSEDDKRNVTMRADELLVALHDDPELGADALRQCRRLAAAAGTHRAARCGLGTWSSAPHDQLLAGAQAVKFVVCRTLLCHHQSELATHFATTEGDQADTDGQQHGDGPGGAGALPVGAAVVPRVRVLHDARDLPAQEAPAVDAHRDAAPPAAVLHHPQPAPLRERGAPQPELLRARYAAAEPPAPLFQAQEHAAPVRARLVRRGPSTSQRRGGGGKKERDMCYTPIIKELRRVLPVNADSPYADNPCVATANDACARLAEHVILLLRNRTERPRVLLPGAGLGRLALEIAAKGYAVQGNEFSYQMLFASNFILNWATQPLEIEVHPWIHNPSNALTITDLLRPVAIPDVAPAELLGLNNGTTVIPPDFSMCAGEFLEAYANDKGK